MEGISYVWTSLQKDTEIVLRFILETVNDIGETDYGKTPRKVLVNLILAFLRAILPISVKL